MEQISERRRFAQIAMHADWVRSDIERQSPTVTPADHRIMRDNLYRRLILEAENALETARNADQSAPTISHLAGFASGMVEAARLTRGLL